MALFDLEQLVDDFSNAIVSSGISDIIGDFEADVKKFGPAYFGGKGLRDLDEGVGELSGRNRARKGQMEQKDALNEEIKLRADQLKTDRDMKQRQDIQASQLAGNLRRQSESNQNLGSDMSQDFLGL